MGSTMMHTHLHSVQNDVPIALLYIKSFGPKLRGERSSKFLSFKKLRLEEFWGLPPTHQKETKPKTIKHPKI
jgi:hypothetical protein